MRQEEDNEQLRRYAAEVPVGTTARGRLCPFCGGGRSRENSFALSRISDAEVRYHCFRASCGKSGRVACWGHRLLPIDPPTTRNGPAGGRGFTPRLYTGHTQKLGSAWLQELLSRYDLTEEDALEGQWSESIEEGLLVCPVFSPLGVRRGVETRQSKLPREGLGGPKTSPYKGVDGPWMGWWRGRVRDGPVVVVEDMLSAAKVARHVQVACLMGSYVGLDHIHELVERSEEQILALDGDATVKAIKFIQRWRFIAPNFRHIRLSKDLKYCSDDEIVSLIKGA